MKKFVFPILFGLISASSLIAGSEVNDRVVRAAIVLKEIMQTPDKSIPQDLLDKSACVAVIPGMKKGGFIFGANYGKGLMSCRTNTGDGPWSAPSMFLLSGRKLRTSNRGSIGRPGPCHHESFRTGKHAQHQVHAGRGRLCSRRTGRQNGIGRNRCLDVRQDSCLLAYARPVCRFDYQGGRHPSRQGCQSGFVWQTDRAQGNPIPAGADGPKGCQDFPG